MVRHPAGNGTAPIPYENRISSQLQGEGFDTSYFGPSSVMRSLVTSGRVGRFLGEIVMDDYALVLNAGSSSLKFCVYRRPELENWRLEARGQIEGIGTSPRLSVKDAEGAKLADQVLDASVRDGRQALDALAAWLRSKYGGARVLGVGHRVVHGGAQHARPTVVTQQVLAELRQLIPLAPLHQPYNLAAIEAVFERLPEVPQVACFDTAFHRGHSAV